MDEELLNKLLERGYSEQKAMTIINDLKAEEEHLVFFRFQELYNDSKD
ncbi:MAG: hypothetical protein IKE33_03915 [Erysipelotrichaceae bacterium]|nr:hypothetical protein [Erysipelotrichaceae bacterium]